MDEAIAACEQAVDMVPTSPPWYERLLVGVGPADVICGDFVPAVAAKAIACGAQLIVVAPYEGCRGSLVTALATSAGVPVLVTRSSTTTNTIVAATDLREAGYPVIRCAADLATELRRSLLIVHSTDRYAPPTLRGELATVGRSFGAGGDVVTMEAHDPADAIIGQARLHDADMIVIGTHRVPQIGVATDSISQSVVCRAHRSVMVTPLRVRSSTEVSGADRGSRQRAGRRAP
ncbi:MAG: universal stress protein [Myxococcales bacterium]|nr:universal stress protein [Myxococcales bacterium]